MKDYWLKLWHERPGSLVGAGVGVLWALLAVRIGFFAAVFVLIAGIVGWFLGTRYDVEASDWSGILERIFQRERD